ncbi:MinD superfamily P-loop ATPase, contains an inserted ferredoxin domain [Syntrophus gentianae]|uniref:MinD superfamily P-loop ATPase, contains an inserted ferredoxin domain n=1 Tax=Syntrophus gentianae TaxID=43775 RepID=A0A1H7V5L3_9BACT|nr:ATP-binding protein [Syntrophus gentianae]SEM04551.1 MinD superfamily P-loop ATPase, contains an inserted ferredoxin domain [Syntrophus gentianae]
MKELVVISGKGGTGKTSLTAAFAALAKGMVLCDADVDAADLHLLTAPKIVERYDFQGGHKAIINHEKCSECGLCRDLCNWSAIDEGFNVAPIDCEGCGVCVYFCPEKAIDFPINTCGEWFISETRFGPMVHARLGIAEENSGRLVTVVRQQATKLAEEKKLELILTDGPPGVGCPVIASIGTATAVLIVVEPTLSGKHDMIRVAELAEQFKVPAMVCVNKFDLNRDETKAIEDTARAGNMEVLEGIPFDPVFTKAMVQGQTLFEYDPRSQTADRVRQIWEKVTERLGIHQS